MSAARQGHTATMLFDGQVLIAGGYPTFVTAELYEPAQQAFKPIVDMTFGRRWHTATLLAINGFVLIAGGEDQSGIALSTAELFIPASATFKSTYPMTTARSFHTATPLLNEEVLIAGGDSTGSAELFNPTMRTFTRTGTMNHPRAEHAAVRLTSGRVLITGGNPGGNTAEIFNPSTGRFSSTGSMVQARSGHTATVISGGYVLITGGEWAGTPLSSAEIYDPASGRFSAIHAMSIARAGHTATALFDNTVLIAGGEPLPISRNPFGCFPPIFWWATSTVERFDPATRQFTLVSADWMPVPRALHAATRLPNGEVLVTGGRTLVTKPCYNGGRYPVRSYDSPPTATAELIR
jgi:hypothetical protein